MSTEKDQNEVLCYASVFISRRSAPDLVPCEPIKRIPFKVYEIDGVYDSFDYKKSVVYFKTRDDAVFFIAALEKLWLAVDTDPYEIRNNMPEIKSLAKKLKAEHKRRVEELRKMKERGNQLFFDFI